MYKQSGVSIRRFRSSDLETVRSLIHRTIDSCYSGAYPQEAIAFFKQYHSDERILEGAQQGYTVVLEKSGQIAGTGTIVANHIMRVFIEPGCQRCGYGKRIMQNLEEQACLNGIRKVILDASLVSKKFYDALGYATLRETFIPVRNHQRLDYYEMEKCLTEPNSAGEIVPAKREKGACGQ